MDDCNHPFIGQDGICHDCGQIFGNAVEIPEGYSGKLIEKSILGDMERFDFSDILKREANEIFLQMKIPTHRKKRRQFLIYICLLFAHQKLGLRTDPITIGLKTGLEVNETSKALAMFPEIQTGYVPPDLEYTPADFIPDLVARVGLPSELIPKMVELAHEIMRKDPFLLRESPRKTSAALVYYCTKIFGLETDPTLIAKEACLSLTTINPIYKKISKIHNA